MNRRHWARPLMRSWVGSPTPPRQPSKSRYPGDGTVAPGATPCTSPMRGPLVAAGEAGRASCDDSTRTGAQTPDYLPAGGTAPAKWGRRAAPRFRQAELNIRPWVPRREKNVNAFLWASATCPSFRADTGTQARVGYRTFWARRPTGTPVQVEGGARVAVGVRAEVGVAVTAGVMAGVGVGGPTSVAGNEYAPISHNWPALYRSPVVTFPGQKAAGKSAVLCGEPKSSTASIAGGLAWSLQPPEAPVNWGSAVTSCAPAALAMLTPGSRTATTSPSRGSRPSRRIVLVTGFGLGLLISGLKVPPGDQAGQYTAPVGRPLGVARPTRLSRRGEGGIHAGQWRSVLS